MSDRLMRASFRARLLLITLVALAWRVGYVMVARRTAAVWGDSFSYHYGANLLAAGKGFIDPLRYEFAGLKFPSASHPPLYLVYLAAWSLIGLKSALWHRLASCLLGAATVALIGLLGKRLAGERAGLIAAVLAAAYPSLWLNDAALLSETAAAFAVVLTMLAVDRFREEPSITRSWQLGAAVALAVLGRAELVILLPALMLPLVLRLRGLATRARLVRLGVAGLAALVLLGPWVGYNMVRFTKPVYLSNGLGATLLGGSCDGAFYGSLIGYWTYCPGATDAARIPPPPATTLAHWKADPAGTLSQRHAYFQHYFTGAPDESQRDATARHEAITYIRAHKSQFVLVVAARIGRIWNVFRPWQNAHLDGAVEARGVTQAGIGILMYYFYAALGIAGLTAMRRRRQPIWPYLVLAGIVTFAVALAFGVQRYRIEVDAVLPALAAVGMDAMLRARSTKKKAVAVPTAPSSTTADSSTI